ncbi:hypothetical protein FK220_004775 [Flavobacteriaceae bacterium TP-CH-4]|uniref:Uncharacterized protein n=1 Tax=Pelagihabitans pacificus TaxID=2696054 RepID=A0A967ASG5_9FLAO|nr:hypothetical protein [Pelagihabitans pacificus]NHF58640.1 hypothetical protein [Pelagihabitans pacificus]
MNRKFYFLTLLLCAIPWCYISYAQESSLLLPFRMPLPDDLEKIERLDFDRDGDPDAIKYTIHGDMPVLWIDDDDDMKPDDWEGDLDNDCVLIDRNKDGLFAGPYDLSIDFGDEDGDGMADLQLLVENGDSALRSQWDWSSNIVWFIDDGEQDAHFAYINWDKMDLKFWEHYGHANFYADYHGQNAFTKMNVSSFRFHDFRYSWENPFYFFDIDGDSHSEIAIRCEDTPVFKDKPENINGRVDNELFKELDDDIDATIIGVLDKVYISFDLDNDNGPGNEFDFDMSLQFNGDEGYDYNHMKHPFQSIDGLKEADDLLFDARWRHLTELIYPHREATWDILFKDGNWEECWFVFDEDDDCNRWERVELLQPKAIFKHGMLQEGLDHNPQADEMGDRGEFDLDNSGKGNLYLGSFDGRLHLYGAEWGAWRVDQDAYSYQGYGGLYDRSGYTRTQYPAGRYATVKYSDTNGNGFIDLIEYDLDGDTVFEHTLSFEALGIDDVNDIIEMYASDYTSLSNLYRDMSERQWRKAEQAVATLEKWGLNTRWYSFYKQPGSLREKYSHGYWVNFYCYWDLRTYFTKTRQEDKVIQVDKAFLSGNWETLSME